MPKYEAISLPKQRLSQVHVEKELAIVDVWLGVADMYTVWTVE